jgi:hypothetical protein
VWRCETIFMDLTLMLMKFYGSHQNVKRWENLVYDVLCARLRESHLCSKLHAKRTVDIKHDCTVVIKKIANLETKSYVLVACIGPLHTSKILQKVNCPSVAMSTRINYVARLVLEQKVPLHKNKTGDFHPKSSTHLKHR